MQARVFPLSHIARAAAPVLDASAASAKVSKQSARYWLWLAVLAPCIAHAQVDLSQLDAEMAAPRTQVLVLGSVHLSQLPKGSDIGAARLQPLMDRLAAYKPTIITVENLSGETCDLMRRHRAVYLPEDSATYCPDTSDAARATGLDVPTALGQVRATLGTLPSAPTPPQRRHLAALFLASGDPSSALVQWLQLAQAEQRSGDGLDAALVTRLRAMETRPNESDQIAARLAARLGLPRVYPADDHTGDNVDLGDPVAYGKAIQAAWDKAAPRANAMREREDQLASEGKLLELYRAINLPASQQLAIAVDFRAALSEGSPQRYGYRYMSGWEIRNLRMVSNVRASFAEQPGARVLAVVGAMHKPWFDNWLAQLQGVDIVDAAQVLGTEGQ
ncbi:DUF5694 domain-containing protein [Xanthomonas hortorum pv. vitians]|uniref:DUF5694 domain-containing protein n=1 Tax=Xanthomonas hortorum TaxID=56454 RepID=UPI001CD9C62E|nr:DUF5694 domain-containing protein [Xanthomonas hortorum]MCE4282065.1 DUF5694 domain-containing protein [Xanthomonas hortorum pv. vitians]MCE4285769.1 DUF5694 domain-containing protein [Xanthomonas hortorum pv. vitians]MCE4290519.1 DUF5694 domain-containing protein [Xanthomonas hortorum pv. vitians]MCE4294535.1 DUF5694 domain-containing protein [Xanthomonas hortorum pv. vitians]MCE4516146.1 DUF5694 domain-containing protein [Xanthomonas hortorum pv. vitians]